MGDHITNKRNGQKHFQTISAFSDGKESDHGDNDDENFNENIEAFVRRCTLKRVFLKISQISQENTCAGVPF